MCRPGYRSEGHRDQSVAINRRDALTFQCSGWNAQVADAVGCVRLSASSTLASKS
jgi:hypothetical protein